MKMIYGTKIKSLMLVFISVIFMNYGCSDGVSISNLNLFSTADDVKLGGDVVVEMQKDQTNYPTYNNAEATAYVQSILNEIVQTKDIKYRDVFNYKITIVNTETINAFALPGGYLHVYKGLLKYIDNEATLAAILAHEVAHAERRHATQRMTKTYGAEFLLGMLLGKNPSEIEKIAGNLVSGLGFLYNSRADEYEADEYSFKYLQSTKWYPGAGKYFFEKIKGETNNGSFGELFSTHPLDQKRIDAVNQMITDAKLNPPSESNIFTQRYTAFKQILN